MLNSRNVSDLREDVAENCRVLLDICQKQGLKVLVTGTRRDNEYQELCYKNGTAKTKVTDFHGSGLAFDICQNIKGHEYSDLSFFANVAIIAKKIGFSWGGDWKSFPDRPHFQWDNHGKYSGKMVLAGNLPPKMPKYKLEDEEMTQEQFNSMMDNYLKSREKLLISDWANPSMDWAYNSSILTGDETGNLKPQCFVTRQELACMLERLAKIK